MRNDGARNLGAGRKKDIAGLMNALVLMSLVTSIFALLTCVYTLANQTYPEALRQRGQLVPVLVYVSVTICAAITIWETWKNTVASGGSGAAGF